MKSYLAWLNRHKYEAHLTAFLLMILPPVGLYFAAQSGAVEWIYILLVPFILANLLELAVQ